ncbi:hypothetical protein MJG53_003971 [Ovis ammon polii x Ovis aries]|uniref:Uncharacterized protein n=1 Tax=Ovis ammon polii x Ovis aries TaxID=2918886 RepID=A0ACB9V8W3_9CETA|nr:hypothetical protein MJG53_003971 [Ovis ammon polii x Ovis aries]
MPTVKNSEEILTSEWWSQYMVSYRNEKCELSPTLILQDILAVYVLPVLFRQDRKETSLHWAPRIRSGKSLCWFSCPPGTVAWVAQIRRSRGLASCGRSMVFLTLGQFNLTLALGQRSRSAPALAGEEGYHVWSDMAARAPAIIFLFLGKTQKGGNGEKDKKVLFFETEKLQGPREDSIQYLTDKGVCCRSWPRLTVRHELAPTLMTVFTKLDRKGLTALIRGTGLDWSLCQATEQDRWLGCPDSSGHVEEC